MSNVGNTGVSGIEELNKEFSRRLKNLNTYLPSALLACGLDLSSASAKLAPIESGDLRNSAHAQLLDDNTVEVGFNLPYARRQHDNLDYRHDRTDGYRRPDGTTVNLIAGGQALYLEEPFNARVNNYIDYIRMATWNSLRR